MALSAAERKQSNARAAKRFREKAKGEKQKFQNRIAQLEKHNRCLEERLASRPAPCSPTKRPPDSFAVEMHCHAYSIAFMNTPVVDATPPALPPFDLSAQVDYLRSAGLLSTDWRSRPVPPHEE